MSLAWRTWLVCGAWFAVANILCAVLVRAAWPALHRVMRRVGASAAARLALGARVMPTLAAAVVAVVGGLAFIRHEPIRGDESVSIAVIALAALGALLAGGTLLRAAAALVSSERLARAWTAAPPDVRLPAAGLAAWTIDAEFPVVAVVGIRRPRLVVARSVIARCTPAELAAIGAHEAAHLDARDNLKALWIRAVVDGLTGSRLSAALLQCWQQASEDLADDAASAGGSCSLDLASALVTVARLSPSRTLTAWPAATCFYRGDGLERRVRRLLDPERPAASSSRTRRAPGAWMAAAGAGLAAGSAGLARPLYSVAEWVIQYLP